MGAAINHEYIEIHHVYCAFCNIYLAWKYLWHYRIRQTIRAILEYRYNFRHSLLIWYTVCYGAMPFRLICDSEIKTFGSTGRHALNALIGRTKVHEILYNGGEKYSCTLWLGIQLGFGPYKT